MGESLKENEGARGQLGRQEAMVSINVSGCYPVGAESMQKLDIRESMVVPE